MSEEGDGPDLREGLRGMAHLYDLTRQTTGRPDPQLRKMVDQLDNVTLDDVLTMGNQAISEGTADPQMPHVNVRDSENPIEVIADTTGTPVSPDAVIAQAGDSTVQIRDPSSGWNSSVKVPGGYEIGTVDVTAKDGIVTVTIYEQEQVDETFSGGIDVDQTSGMEIEDLDTSDNGGIDAGLTGTPEREPEQEDDTEVPTVEEFIEENEWVKDALGEETVSMARKYAGDQPVDQVLGSQLDGMFDVEG